MSFCSLGVSVSLNCSLSPFFRSFDVNQTTNAKFFVCVLVSTLQHSLAPDGDKIHLSGPLLHPSRNLDQMLKDHDRRIQEAARRARNDKVKHSKVLAW